VVEERQAHVRYVTFLMQCCVLKLILFVLRILFVN
jgi:hypothetical protein